MMYAASKGENGHFNNLTWSLLINHRKSMLWFCNLTKKYSSGSALADCLSLFIHQFHFHLDYEAKVDQLRGIVLAGMTSIQFKFSDLINPWSWHNGQKC